MSDNQIKSITTPVTVTENQDLESADWDTLVRIGKDVTQWQNYTQWALGKLGDITARKYGGLLKYANETGQSYGSLSQYVYTYRKYIKENPSFNPNKYFGTVSWSMLALMATKSDKPSSLIEKMQDKGIKTLHEARTELNTVEPPNFKNDRPNIRFVWNSEIRKYEFVMDPRFIPAISWPPEVIKIIFKEDIEEGLITLEELLMRINNSQKKPGEQKNEK